MTTFASKKTQVILKYSLLGTFLVLFLRFFANNTESFYSLGKITLGQFLTLSLLNFALYIVNGAIINTFTNVFGVKLSMFEQYYLSIMTTFGNYFLPFRGGAAMRGMYLKKKIQSYLLKVYGCTCGAADYHSIRSFERFIPPQLTNPHRVRLLELSHDYFGAMLFLGTLIPLFYSKYIYNLIAVKAVRKRLFLLYRGWRLVCKRPQQLVRLFGLSVLCVGIAAATLFCEFRFLGITSPSGISPTIYDAMFLSVFQLLSSILIITPGALGIREGLMMAAAGMTSVTATSVLVASVLDRAVNITFVVASFALTAGLAKRRASLRHSTSR